MRARVLIVEDEAAIADLLVEALADLDYEVSSAPHGLAALRQLDTAHPDLLITDLMMPLMNGEQLCLHLRQLPAFQSLPIIMMSAALDLPPSLEGANIAFVSKPFAIDQLLGLAQQLLGA
jgi:DNA-binding response OmpR family regulator